MELQDYNRNLVIVCLGTMAVLRNHMFMVKVRIWESDVVRVRIG